MKPTELVVAACAALVAAPVAAHEPDVPYVETQAAPPRDTSSQARVGAAELETTSPRATDDLLRAVPGLAVVQHGNVGKGLQFYLRGFDAVHGSDFAVSVEDVPLNEFGNVHGHGYVDLGFIVPEAVAYIDVTRGAYALAQGNFATAGSVDLGLGAAPWDQGASVTYEIGTTNRHRLVGLQSNADGVTAAEALYDAGFGEGRQSMRGTATAARRLGRVGNAQVSTLLSAGAAQFELPGALRLDDVTTDRVGFYDSYDVGFGDSARILAALPVRSERRRVRWALVPYVIGRTLTLEENFTGFLREPERGDRRRQVEGSLVAGARSRLAVTKVPGTARAVLDARHNRVRHTEDAVLASGEAWQCSRDLDAATNQFALGLGWDHVVGAFGFGIAARGEIFDYRIRGDDPRLIGVLVPRATTRLFLGDLTLFLAAGQGYRAPEPRAVFTEGPSDDPSSFDGGNARMSVANNAEVGVRYYADAFEVGATAFGVLVDREVVYDHVSGTNLELDGTRRVGGEVDAEVRVASLLQLAADVTVVDARFRALGTTVPGAPRVLSTLRAFAGRPHWFRAGLSATYLGVRPLPHGARTADSVLVGVTGSAEIGSFELGVDIDNALGQRVRDGEYHFASWWDRDDTRSALPAVHTVASSPIAARFHLTYRFDSGDDE